METMVVGPRQGIFHDNRETGIIYHEMEFPSLLQGYMLVTNYCWRLKNLADGDGAGRVSSSASRSAGLFMILVRHLWGYAYSNEEEVVQYVVKMMPTLAVSFLFDDLQCGLWLGIMCALIVQMLWLLATNWEKEALKANERVFSSS
uniref:Uncharacterized protein n=1 Tax=Oryza meridionalis TaxID=40149 RepID=A0A0E0DD58_9ORYZ